MYIFWKLTKLPFHYRITRLWGFHTILNNVYNSSVYFFTPHPVHNVKFVLETVLLFKSCFYSSHASIYWQTKIACLIFFYRTFRKWLKTQGIIEFLLYLTLNKTIHNILSNSSKLTLQNHSYQMVPVTLKIFILIEWASIRVVLLINL